MNDYMRSIIRDGIDRKRSLVLHAFRNTHYHKGWIATIRQALAMNQKVLGERASITKQMVSRLEERERSGEIRLDQLRGMADALGCEVVYAFLPREPLEKTMAELSKRAALKELKAVDRTMQLEDQAVPLDEKRVQNYVSRVLDEKDVWK
jgi:predicted DNA-binding mobile mystery protein A